MEHEAAIADSRKPRPRRRRRSRLIVWIVFLCISIGSVVVTYGVLQDRARGGAGMPAYSVYSDAADGYAQAAALLRNLGWQPVVVTRPIQQTHHHGLLILADPVDPLGVRFTPSLSDPDVSGLLDWVAQGNTLLFCSQRNTALHDKLSVVVTEPGGNQDTVYLATPGAVGEYTAGIDRIGLEQPNTISGRKGVPLWWLGNRAAAVVVRHGAGRVLLLPDQSLLTHRGLRREDNAVFLYNVAALDAVEGRVFFDEYHHGIRSGGGYWSYLRYHSQHWILLQLLLVAVMALWAVGRRLGPAVPMPVTKRADGVDYASSVARIYEKADVKPLVAGIVSRHFLAELTRHLRLRRNAESKEITATWKQRYGEVDLRELNQLLRAADDLRQGEILNSRQLVGLAQRFDAFLNKQAR